MLDWPATFRVQFHELRTAHMTIVVAAVIERENQVLICRAKGVSGAPVEANETPVAEYDRHRRARPHAS
jgi:hypothetical protein